MSAILIHDTNWSVCPFPSKVWNWLILQFCVQKYQTYWKFIIFQETFLYSRISCLSTQIIPRMLIWLMEISVYPSHIGDKFVLNKFCKNIFIQKTQLTEQLLIYSLVTKNYYAKCERTFRFRSLWNRKIITCNLADILQAKNSVPAA